MVTRMRLVDIGLNLAHRRFDDDREEVVRRARQAGVVGALLTGTSLASSARVLELAEASEGWARATVGVHPHEAQQLDEAAARELEALARRPACAAVGECGLDFERNFSPRPAQERAFERQLDLAARLGLPVFLHQRGAMPRFGELLAAFRPRLGAVVVHCFTDGPEIARALLDLDVELGITGWICDERRSAALRAALSVIPLHRVMVETDAPYLSPRDIGPESPVPGVSPARLKARNEPAVLPWVARATARAMGQPEDALAAASTALAQRTFALSLPPPPC